MSRQESRPTPNSLLCAVTVPILGSWDPWVQGWSSAPSGVAMPLLPLGPAPFEEFLDRSASFFGQETHEQVKTIKKRCVEAKNDIFHKHAFKKGVLSRRLPLHVPTFGPILRISDPKLIF